MISLFQDFFTGYVLKSNRLGDCTNGGISSKYDTLYLCNDNVTKADVLEYCKETGENPQRFLKVDKLKWHSGEYVRLVQLVHPNDDRAIGGMAGGNYLESSDSRFSEITGISYPVAIHDRYETQEQYDLLSH